MQKLDRLGWAGGVAFAAYGRTIGIRWNVAPALEDVLACLPPGSERLEALDVEHLLSLRFARSVSRPGTRVFHLLYAGVRPAARSLDRQVVFTALEQELGSYLAQKAQDRVFVHAGVVAWQNRAVLLPGRSRAGKSTLVAALLARGATYYSDEFAVLDAGGRVHPYPRRLSLRRPRGTERATAESLGAAAGSGPAPVGMVVRSDYLAGIEWRPRRLSAARALVELASYTLPQVAQTPLGQSALTRIVESAPTYKGPRGEADATADAILKALESLP